MKGFELEFTSPLNIADQEAHKPPIQAQSEYAGLSQMQNAALHQLQFQNYIPTGCTCCQYNSQRYGFGAWPF